MTYNPDIHHRQSIRMKNYDYSEVGYYFVTICTEGRRNRFGKIENGLMDLNIEGLMIEKWWKELGVKYTNIRLDEYIIMPNHMHGIIEIKDPLGVDLNVGHDPVGADLRVCPLNQDEHIGSPLQKPNIGKMIQWFKTITTNECIRSIKSGIFPSFEKRLWQRNYWEHIIRDEPSLVQIREYIINNPNAWESDSLFGNSDIISPTSRSSPSLLSPK